EALSAGLRVVPVLTGDAALPAEADLPADIAGLSRRQYLPLRNRYTPVDLAFLVERITDADPELAKIAAERRSRITTADPESAELAALHQASAGWVPRPRGELPQVWNLPPRNPGFIARGGELEQIRVNLAAGPVATVQAVRGMGGVGKTQAAIEYAYRNAADYELVWWIDAENPQLITSQVVALGATLGL